MASYTCIRQAAIQVELVRACTEAGVCGSVSTQAVHPLCFTGVCFCCLSSICFSRVFVPPVSEIVFTFASSLGLCDQTVLQGSLCHAGMGGDPRAAAAKP